jgi:DNA gyrase subunit A
MGRATQGVRLINIKEKDSIAGIASVPREDDEEELTEGAEGTVEGSTEGGEAGPESAPEITNNENE